MPTVRTPLQRREPGTHLPPGAFGEPVRFVGCAQVPGSASAWSTDSVTLRRLRDGLQTVL